MANKCKECPGRDDCEFNAAYGESACEQNMRDGDEIVFSVAELERRITPADKIFTFPVEWQNGKK